MRYTNPRLYFTLLTLLASSHTVAHTADAHNLAVPGSVSRHVQVLSKRQVVPAERKSSLAK